TVRAADIGSSAIVNLIPGDAQIYAYADRGINAVIGDPTRMGDIVGQVPIGLEGVTNAALGQSTNFQIVSFAAPWGYFTTYTANSAFTAFAAGGDITLGATTGFVPGIMEVVAPNGSITNGSTGIVGSVALLATPTPTAQVDFLAGQNIGNGLGVSMTDINM